MLVPFKYLLWITSLLLPFEVELNHAFYLSTIQIALSDSKGGEIEIRVFWDDLENALKNENKNSFTFNSDHKTEIYKQFVERYFSNHLEIKVNQQKQPFKLQSINRESDSFHLYFKFEIQSQVAAFEVQTDYLTEIFPDQINVLTFKYGGKHSYKRLSRKDKKFTYKPNPD